MGVDASVADMAEALSAVQANNQGKKDKSKKANKAPKQPHPLENLTFDEVEKNKEIFANARNEIRKLSHGPNNGLTKDGKLLLPVQKSLDACEQGYSQLSDVCFKLVKEVVRLAKIVEANEFAGSMITSAEEAPVHINMCKEAKEANYICKIPNLPMGEPIKGTTAHMVNKIRARLHRAYVDLRGVSIIPLANETEKTRNNLHVVPVLLKCDDESRQHRNWLERRLKDARFHTSFHWPEGLIDNVKLIREQMKDYKDANIEVEPQLMIRPSSTGKSLVISHRRNFNSKWKFITTVKTPASKELLNETGLEQPAKSKFFDLSLSPEQAAKVREQHQAAKRGQPAAQQQAGPPPNPSQSRDEVQPMAQTTGQNNAVQGPSNTNRTPRVPIPSGPTGDESLNPSLSDDDEVNQN